MPIFFRATLYTGSDRHRQKESRCMWCENVKAEEYEKVDVFLRFVAYTFSYWSFTLEPVTVLVVLFTNTHSLLSLTNDIKLTGYWQMCYSRLGWMLLTELSAVSHWGVRSLLQLNRPSLYRPFPVVHCAVMLNCLCKSKACASLNEVLESIIFRWS